jgi:hypothetical protein
MRLFVAAALPLLATLGLMATALWGVRQAYLAFVAIFELISVADAAQTSQDAMFKVLDK